MLPLTTAEVAKATGGRLMTKDKQNREFLSLTTDSRRVEKNALFVALKGEHYDGHAFIKNAVASGATGVILENLASVPTINGCAVIAVENSKAALLKIAQLIKAKLNCLTVGITGSNGKTTVKELAAQILKQKFKVLSSPLNYNNEIGIPLTLAKAQVDVEILVLELAMRGLNQIKQLAEAVQPEIGVITNIGLSHIELLGSLEKIAQAKLELVEALPAKGLAILNYDDAWFSYFKKHTKVQQLTFGLSPHADVGAEKVKLDAEGRPSFYLRLPNGQKEKVFLQLLGKHNVSNALAAAAIGFAFNLPISVIVSGLEQEIPAKMRLQPLILNNGAKIINDAYNASPASVTAALEVLAQIKAKRRLVILGPMAELGSFTEEAHQEVGSKIAAYNIDILITVGQTAALTGEMVAKKSSRTAVFNCADVEEAGEQAVSLIKKGDVILVKGSRVAQLEKVVQKLISEV